MEYGAEEKTRTSDPRITNALLYQLSYFGKDKHLYNKEKRIARFFLILSLFFAKRTSFVMRGSGVQVTQSAPFPKPLDFSRGFVFLFFLKKELRLVKKRERTLDFKWKIRYTAAIS